MKWVGGLARRLRQEVRERLLVELGEPLKLYDINPALPRLALREVGLRLVERLCGLHLGEARLAASGPQADEELSISR